MRRLATEMAPLALEAWIRPLAVRAETDRLVLIAPNAFHSDRIRSRFLGTLRACVSAETGAALELGLEVAADLEPTPTLAPTRPAAAALAPVLAVAPASEGAEKTLVPARPAAQLALPSTFETFVVGAENALAREASYAVARGRAFCPGPLFLVGPTGTGKSHLARALVHEARQNGVARAVYTSAEAFTGDLLASIRAHETPTFRRRFRRECDLLVLEDVQFLEGKSATQLELFHTVEHLRLVGARVVVTADRLPRELARMDGRLVSQLASGLVAELELPDRTLRRDILRDRAARGGFRLPDDCLALLVDGVRGSARDLEGALTQLVVSAALLGRSIDLALTEQALRKLGAPERAALSLDDVIECVAQFYGVARSELCARSRRRAALRPRQLAMYLAHRFTEASLSEIGRALGRDHPAVTNALRAVERAILERAPLRYQVEELAARLDRRTPR
jgi:chromosomal replication initiator protein